MKIRRSKMRCTASSIRWAGYFLLYFDRYLDKRLRQETRSEKSCCPTGVFLVFLNSSRAFLSNRFSSHAWRESNQSQSKRLRYSSHLSSKNWERETIGSFHSALNTFKLSKSVRTAQVTSL